jgi:hypothetical protein
MASRCNDSRQASPDRGASVQEFSLSVQAVRRSAVPTDLPLGCGGPLSIALMINHAEQWVFDFCGALW